MKDHQVLWSIQFEVLGNRLLAFEDLHGINTEAAQLRGVFSVG